MDYRPFSLVLFNCLRDIIVFFSVEITKVVEQNLFVDKVTRDGKH